MDAPANREDAGLTGDVRRLPSPVEGSPRRLKPSRDPNVPHPGRTFSGGQWRTPEQIERRREHKRRYHEENIEAVRERVRRWREENAERKRKYERRYRKENIEAVREASCERSRRRRARKRRATVGPIPPEYLAFLLAGPCFYCGADAEHIDHFVPLARQGPHRITNVVGACARCNLSKGTRSPAEFITTRAAA